MAEHSTRTVVAEVKYVSSTNLVAHTENCKLDIPLNCSVKELEKTLIRMCSLRAGFHFRCYNRCGASGEAASYESARGLYNNENESLLAG